MTENKNVPRIRFDGFNDAWEERKLSDISNVTKLAGFEFTKYVRYQESGKIIALRGLNVKNGKLVLDEVKYIDDSDFSKLNRSKLYKNDILLTYVGTVGELAIVPENDKYYLAPNVARIRLQDHVNSIFVCQMMNDSNFYNRIISPLIATSSQPALSMENVRKFQLLMPDYQEQEKIGSFFKQLDDTIALHQRKVEVLQNLKKALLQRMFASKDNPIPDIRFAGFTDPWEQRKLENIAQINKGIQRGKQEISSVRNELNPYPVYNGGKKASGYTDECNRENSVMVSEGGASAGYVNYYSGKYWSGGHNFTISNDTKHDTFFLLYVLQKSQEKLYKLQVGTGLPNIQLKLIKNFPIYSTSNTEQQKIGSFFKQLDDTIALHQLKIDKLKEIKKWLMQNMFV